VDMRRRAFIALLGGATVAWPFAARAQQSKVRRIGCLLLGNTDAESFSTELRDGLRKLGYVEGQNINFHFRSAEGNIDLLPMLAAELVALRLDVIVALYTPCALAAQHATREIPIVVVSGESGRDRSGDELESPGREHHGPIPDGSRDAREMCRVVPRHAPIRAPRRRSAQRRGSILETD
jgi:putative tryptophan/tyrosine transport system substrate-binding protein